MALKEEYGFQIGRPGHQQRLVRLNNLEAAVQASDFHNAKADGPKAHAVRLAGDGQWKRTGLTKPPMSPGRSA